MTETTITTPRLATGVRLAFDKVRDRPMLLFPEGAAALNATAAGVLELCDGQRTIDDIAVELGEQYGEGADLRDDVTQLIESLAARGLVVDASA